VREIGGEGGNKGVLYREGGPGLVSGGHGLRLRLGTSGQQFGGAVWVTLRGARRVFSDKSGRPAATDAVFLAGRRVRRRLGPAGILFTAFR